MSVIDCDYLPHPEQLPFPPELALLIVRKAAAMAEAFEEQALDQLTKDARQVRDALRLTAPLPVAWPTAAGT